jgi:hypothetical protein
VKRASAGQPPQRFSFKGDENMVSTEDLKKVYGKRIVSRFKVRKYMGDDRYSWAVFKGSTPVVTGCLRDEAMVWLEQLCKAEHDRGL